MNELSQSSIKNGKTIEFPSTRHIQQFSHTVFNRYPARSICLIPRSILADLKSQEVKKGKKLKVLDPFMGSGTTAVEASLVNMESYGVEMDNFAKLVAQVKVTGFSNAELKYLYSKYQEIKMNWMEFSADRKLAPKVKDTDYWFTEINFEDLLKLKNAIYTMVKKADYLNFFKVVFADMIRPTSLAERQSLKPFISKKYPKIPATVGDAFTKSFEKHFKGIREFSEHVDGSKYKINWLGNNAVSFESEENLIDVAITSPPYINALDYVRCIKIESSWVDCSDDAFLKELRSIQVGGGGYSVQTICDILPGLKTKIAKIAKTDSARAKIVEGYFWSINENLKRVHKSLKKNGSYHFIVGNSVICGIEIPTDKMIQNLAVKCGYKIEKAYRYIIKDHRLSIPRMGEGGKINYEYVISLTKV